MDTAAISYRVADFLKQHPPFNAIDDEHLVALAAHGRVRFYEPNEFILWQGEPHKPYVFVIQQGVVSLWDEHGGQAALRDVRGAGDLLGVERFNGERACSYSARSTSDVVIYGFPEEDFETLVLSSPYARQYVAALGSVTADFQRTDERADPRRMFLHEVAGPLLTCGAQQSAADAARMLASTGADALAVVDADSRLLGLITTRTLLTWLAEGGSAARPASELATAAPPTVGPDATITDGVIAMASTHGSAVALTTDGMSTGRLVSVVTARDLTPAFGDQPAAILRDVHRAGDVKALRSLNRRARACALQHLTSAASTEWIARFAELVDHAILARILALTGLSGTSACWCVCGASGRGESVAKREPRVLLIHERGADGAAALDDYARVVDSLSACEYLQDPDTPSDPSFYAAGADEWSSRYRGWIQNPVIEGMARHRALFDVRPVHGPRALWDGIRAGVARAIDRDIVQVLAHDCLANLPPLTFFRDAVVDHTGEQTAVFRLEQTALQPLVDLGRVFGMAARDVVGTSTLERFALARRLLPANEAIFREASDTLRIVLWQQGRIGISQGTTGSELPPSLLSRHDRHMLRSGFPVIHRLLEFSSNPSWLDAIS